jgi:hypothetical protein
MKKTNDNGKCIEIKESFIHLVYFKWKTQPDNSVSYNLCITKDGQYIDSEYPRKRNELSELRREKLKRINQLTVKEIKFLPSCPVWLP